MVGSYRIASLGTKPRILIACISPNGHGRIILVLYEDLCLTLWYLGYLYKMLL